MAQSSVPKVASIDHSAGHDSVPVLVALALLSHDLPDATVGERDAAGRYVSDSVAGLADSTRLGVRVAGTAVYAVLSLMGGAAYRTLPDHRRSVLAVRLFRRPLPVLAEFGTLTRGLGLVGAHQARYESSAAP